MNTALCGGRTSRTKYTSFSSALQFPQEIFMCIIMWWEKLEIVFLSLLGRCWFYPFRSLREFEIGSLKGINCGYCNIPTIFSNYNILSSGMWGNVAPEMLSEWVYVVLIGQLAITSLSHRSSSDCECHRNVTENSQTANGFVPILSSLSEVDTFEQHEIDGVWPKQSYPIQSNFG